MTQDYIIQKNFTTQWLRGRTVCTELLSSTPRSADRAYLPVHGDSMLSQLDEHDLVCYFVYSISSWWEIPLIDRINANRDDNNFAIIMDINPAPETIYRMANAAPGTPEIRYKSGLKQIFPSVEDKVTDAMYNLLRNGFGHNLFGREPGRIYFDNSFVCPPRLDNNDILLIPPIQLALSMVTAFLSKIAMLLQYPSDDRMRVFKIYMTGKA